MDEDVRNLPNGAFGQWVRFIVAVLLVPIMVGGLAWAWQVERRLTTVEHSIISLAERAKEDRESQREIRERLRSIESNVSAIARAVE